MFYVFEVVDCIYIYCLGKCLCVIDFKKYLMFDVVVFMIGVVVFEEVVELVQEIKVRGIFNEYVNIVVECIYEMWDIMLWLLVVIIGVFVSGKFIFVEEVLCCLI